MTHLTLDIIKDAQKPKEQKKFYENQKKIADFVKNKLIPQIKKYDNSKEKDNLLFNLYQIVRNINLNTYEILYNQPGSDIISLDIKYTDKYIMFDYYQFDELGYIWYEAPLIIIISPQYNKYFFIQETSSEFSDNENCDVSTSFFVVSIFKIQNGLIKENTTTIDEYTSDMFDDIFNVSDINTTLEIIEDNATEVDSPKKLSLEF